MPPEDPQGGRRPVVRFFPGRRRNVPITIDRFLQACAVPLEMPLQAGAAGLTPQTTDQRVQKAGLAITGEGRSSPEGRSQVLGDTEPTYFESQPVVRQAGIVDVF